MNESNGYVVALTPQTWLRIGWETAPEHIETDQIERAAQFTTQPAGQWAKVQVQRWRHFPAATVRQRVDDS